LAASAPAAVASAAAPVVSAASATATATAPPPATAPPSASPTKPPAVAATATTVHAVATATAAPPATATAPKPFALPLPASPYGSDDATGQLTVVCSPKCDAVFDGLTPLSLPVVKQRLTVGSHRIKAVWTNPSASQTISVMIIAGKVDVERATRPQ